MMCFKSLVSRAFGQPTKLFHNKYFPKRIIGKYRMKCRNLCHVVNFHFPQINICPKACSAKCTWCWQGSGIWKELNRKRIYFWKLNYMLRIFQNLKEVPMQGNLWYRFLPTTFFGWRGWFEKIPLCGKSLQQAPAIHSLTACLQVNLGLRVKLPNLFLHNSFFLFSVSTIFERRIPPCKCLHIYLHLIVLPTSEGGEGWFQYFLCEKDLTFRNSEYFSWYRSQYWSWY